MRHRPSYRDRARLLVAVSLIVCSGPAATAQPGCSLSDSALRATRTIEIDASTGPIFGAFTKQAKEISFLRPKEVVLTFDDGPMPWITRSIMDSLDAFCVKATFFSVGRMAIAYPDVVKEIIARGHTLGTHTMTHPFNMHRMAPYKAHEDIERGFAAVAAAAGTPIAPFFRFPGLADSRDLLDYLQTRGIATFTVDVVSDDSYIHDPTRLAATTLARVEQNGGGIILFHDIKRSTAKALPQILKGLQSRGFKVVHMRAAAPVQPHLDLLVAMTEKLAKGKKSQTNQTLVPFYGSVGPEPRSELQDDEVTVIAHPPRVRTLAKPDQPRASDTMSSTAGDRPAIVKSDGSNAPTNYRKSDENSRPTVPNSPNLR